MKDKTILITGATSGIGKAAAVELARQGARVVGTYRDLAKGDSTLKEIKKATGNKEVYMLELDLASLESVRNLADKFGKDFDSLDVLINNAGGYFGYHRKTVQGFEYTFGVNHLGHFFLTNLLKDMLIDGNARIINVSSAAQMMGSIHFDDLMSEKKYRGFRAYAQAKLANIIFSYELDRRWGDTGITANAVHPGAVGSNFGYDARPVFKFLIKLGKPILKSPEKGAETIVYLATSPEVEGVSGKYFINRKPVKSKTGSYKVNVWNRLWNESEALTGLQVAD